MPASPLHRLRLAFLFVALASLLASVVALATASDLTAGRRALGLLATVVLAAHWTHGYRRGGFAAWSDVLDPAALLVVLIACRGELPVPLMGMIFRSLYGGVPAALPRTIGYVGVLYLARAWEQTATLGETTSRAIGIALAAWLISLLARSMERVERSERRLRSIVEHSSDVITIAGPDLRVRWQAGASQSVLGRDAERLIGASLLDLIHPDDVEDVRESLVSVIACPEASGVFSARWRAADQTYRHVEGLVANRLHDPDVPGLLLNVRDATERRRLERLRVRVEAQRERQQLEAKLQRSRRMESVGQLAGGVAHDFNNLLAVILNAAVLMRDELPRDASAHAELVAIEDAARRGARLVRHLLQFSQREPSAARRVGLNETIEGMDDLLNRSLGGGVRLAYGLDPSAAPVHADLSNVEQVLVNLVVNARDAVGESGTVTVTTANVTVEPDDTVDMEVAAGDYVRLSVADDGCGMDPDTLRRAWEPFFTTKGPGQGTGLGLSTVFGIARQGGGCVTIDSVVGVGTTVHVHLPVAAQDAVVAG